MSNYTDTSYYIKSEEFTGFYCEMGIKEILYREKSEFQLIEIVDTIPFGKALITDGILMITEMDEAIYHEMMVHLPLSLVKEPKNLLIIGGGDGGCARETSKYQSIEKIDLVEIDEKILQATQKYLKTWDGTNYKKLNIYIDDGFKFLKTTTNQYDAIIIDISAPIEIAKDLYSRESFERINQILSDEGVFVIQSESVYLTPNVSKYILHQIKDLIKFSSVYSIWVPSFFSPWSFVIGSKKNPPEKPKYNNLPPSTLKNLKSYSQETHISSFALPPYIKEYLNQGNHEEFAEILNKNILRKILEKNE